MSRSSSASHGANDLDSGTKQLSQPAVAGVRAGGPMVWGYCCCRSGFRFITFAETCSKAGPACESSDRTRRYVPQPPGTVQSPFSGCLPIPQPVAGLNEIFEEAKAQIRGEYRLAGGESRKIESIQWKDIEDSEDHHAYHRLRWAVRYSRAAAYGCPGAEQALSRDLDRWLATDWDADAVSRGLITSQSRIASLAQCLAWTRVCRSRL